MDYQQWVELGSYCYTAQVVGCHGQRCYHGDCRKDRYMQLRVEDYRSYKSEVVDHDN